MLAAGNLRQTGWSKYELFGRKKPFLSKKRMWQGSSQLHSSKTDRRTPGTASFVQTWPMRTVFGRRPSARRAWREGSQTWRRIVWCSVSNESCMMIISHLTTWHWCVMLSLLSVFVEYQRSYQITGEKNKTWLNNYSSRQNWGLNPNLSIFWTALRTRCCIMAASCSFSEYVWSALENPLLANG